MLVGQARASGSAFGIVMTGRNVGVLIGPVLLPWLLQRSGDWESAAPAFGAGTLFAVGLGLAVVLLMRPPAQTA
jgi:MFS family permease